MIKTNLEPVLAAHPFFQGLKGEYVQFMVGCASNVSFDAGKDIYHEGEDASTFYIIRHGKIAVDCLVPGRGVVTIETLTEGDVLGWSWLFPPYRTHFNARALELTRAIALDGKCLRGKCDEDPAMGYEVMKRVAHIMMQRLQATRLQLLDVYGTPGRK
jgi:CRP/FNR family cyclic AMP-dependent transcriptional regulator